MLKIIKQADKTHNINFHSAYRTFRKYYQSGLPLFGRKLEKFLTFSWSLTNFTGFDFKGYCRNRPATEHFFWLNFLYSSSHSAQPKIKFPGFPFLVHRLCPARTLNSWTQQIEGRETDSFICVHIVCSIFDQSHFNH